MVWQNIKHYICVLHLLFLFCIWNLFLLEMGFLSAYRWTGYEEITAVDSHLLEYDILSAGKLLPTFWGFVVKQSKKSDFLDCLAMQLEALWSFETIVTVC